MGIFLIVYFSTIYSNLVSNIALMQHLENGAYYINIV